MGIAAVQAMARHRLYRVPFVGVPRAVVETRMRRGQQLGGMRRNPDQDFNDLHLYQRDIARAA